MMSLIYIIMITNYLIYYTPTERRGGPVESSALAGAMKQEASESLAQG